MAALFVVTPNWKQCKSLPTGEWINYLRYMYQWTTTEGKTNHKN